MILSPDSLIQKRYLIVRLIAQGGMGAVYKASDQQTKKTVALKQSLVSDPQFNKAFEREARMLSRLRHPVLPIVSDYFTEESGQFLVMQFIPGDDLGTLLERQAQKFLTANAIPWVMSWAEQLLEALDYLHKQEYPIIHRDLKPQNLKLTSRGEIRLLDFGLAKSAADHTKHSMVQSVRGYTPQYASLEQIQGTGTEPCSDLYSLAATLYHMLTGTPPVDALERVASVLSGRPDPLQPAHELNALVSPEISSILQQSMELEKKHRFETAQAMRTALSMATQSRKKPTSSGQKTILAPSASVPAAEPSSSASAPVQKTEALVDPSVASSAPAPAAHQPSCIVDQHGKGNYTTIGEALKQARPGDRILVRPGLYKEGLILDRSVEIVGDGPVSDVIIESTGLHCIQMQTDYAVVRGLTLRERASSSTSSREQPFFAVDIPQGRLFLDQCTISSETRIGVAVHGAEANPILWRCTIRQSKGTGILFYEQGRGIIEECDIAGHGLAGIGITQKSNPHILRCTIHHGKQDGIYVSEQGAGTIEECTISHNQRAGIEIKHEGNPFIRWCTIHDQVSGYGIYVYHRGEGTIVACDIFNNAEAGVGVTQQGNPFLRQCTIHDEKQRGIVFLEDAQGTLEQCTIRHATLEGVRIGKACNPVLRSCQIHEGKQGGVLILDHGAGMIESCTIAQNGQAGIEIRQHGNPLIRQCAINHNRMTAVYVHKNGAGSVEECDLTNNKRGAWNMEAGSLVLGSGNME